MLRWFPDRRFVFVGDSGFGTHELARCCHRRHGGWNWSASSTPTPALRAAAGYGGKAGRG